MDLNYNETQILLRDTMREYLANEVPFDRIRKHEKSGEADAELWAELCKLGWMEQFPAKPAIEGRSKNGIG